MPQHENFAEIIRQALDWERRLLIVALHGNPHAQTNTTVVSLHFEKPQHERSMRQELKMVIILFNT
jgi:hypothetical protein